MPNLTSSIINKYNSNVTKGAPVAADVAVDGDFANWAMLNYPDSWAVSDILLDSTAVEGWARSTDKHAGTYAIELECLKDPGDGSKISASIEGVYDTAVANKTMQARFYAKRGVGTANIAVGAFYYNGADDYEWNLTTSSWIVKGSGDGNVYETITIDGTYTQYTNTQRTIPADGTEFWLGTIAGSANLNDTAIVDNMEWLLDGADVATNGTFEAWTEFADYTDPLTGSTGIVGADWEFGTDVDTSYSYFARSASQQAGTYALSMIVGDSADVISNDDRGYVYQVYAGNPGAAITVSVYSKSTNSKTGYMQFLDAAPGVHANIWDNVADTWDPLVTTVTDLPGTSNSLTCSGTASYVINTETLTIPASGTLCVVLMSDKGDNTTQQTYFFDTLVMTTNVSAGATTLFDFENGSDATNLDVGDAIMDYRTTGGAPASQWKLGGTGVLESSLVAIDYSAIPFIFADPTQDGNPVTKTYFESIVPVNIQSLAISQLGSVAVDYKSTGQTTIYTVPTGFLLRGFYTETKTTAADAVANDSLARMGTSGGGYVDVTGTIVQPSSTIGNVVRSSLTGTTDIAAGGVIQVDVTTADTGTDLDAIVYLYGILISV